MVIIAIFSLLSVCTSLPVMTFQLPLTGIQPDKEELLKVSSTLPVWEKASMEVQKNSKKKVTFKPFIEKPSFMIFSPQDPGGALFFNSLCISIDFQSSIISDNSGTIINFMNSHYSYKLLKTIRYKYRLPRINSILVIAQYHVALTPTPTLPLQGGGSSCNDSIY